MNDLTDLKNFIVRLPGVIGSVNGGVFEKNKNKSGLWWVKFQLNIKHELVWHVIQELANVLNYLSITERLPTVFMPTSSPAYLNGGPEDYLYWVVESTDTEFTPPMCLAWLENRLPSPEDLESWKNDDSEDSDVSDETDTFNENNTTNH